MASLPCKSMLLPGARAPPGAHVASGGISTRTAPHAATAHHAERGHAIGERSGGAVASTAVAGGLPRTPPRTTAGRTSTGGGATGSTSRTSPGNVWSTSTPIASSSSFTAPRTPPGAASSPTGALRTPAATLATACMSADPTTPPHISSAASHQSSLPRSAMNAAPHRRPARKSPTAGTGVRGGVRAGLPNSSVGQGGSQANTSSGTVYSATPHLRGIGRGAPSSASGRPSGQVSSSSKAIGSAAGYISRSAHAMETPGSPRRCARSLSPSQVDIAPGAPAPRRPQPVSHKWVNEDSTSGTDLNEDAVLNDSGMSRVLRALDLSSETSQISPTSPLSPLNEGNERRQVNTVKIAATKVELRPEHADATPPALRPTSEDEPPKLRPHLYANYPTMGLYM